MERDPDGSFPALSSESAFLKKKFVFDARIRSAKSEQSVSFPGPADFADDRAGS